MNRRLVIFMFAGRQANMEVQRPYLDRILTDYPEAELHLWDLSRTEVDHRYLQTLQGAHAGRVHVVGGLRRLGPACLYPKGTGFADGRVPRGWRRCKCIVHKPPYEEPYREYAAGDFEPGDIFVKVDDDVLFLETARFSDLIDPLLDHPNRIISANVINNAVCAKYEPGLVNGVLKGVGDPRGTFHDRDWWLLHTDPRFAGHSHDWFLDNVGNGRTIASGYVRTRPGEALSINCIAFTHATMKRLAPMMNDRLGDEGAVDRLLPWIARSFHAAHLAFGPQEKSLDLDWWRARYTNLSKEYL